MTCDDFLEIFFDGSPAINDGTFNTWNKAGTVSFPWDTKVIAIKCRNGGGPTGILGTFANNAIITDNGWECSDSEETDWMLDSFVGSWSPAHDYGNPTTPGPVTWGNIVGITDTPDWIWTNQPGPNGHQEVYCRKDLSGVWNRLFNAPALQRMVST